MADGERPPPGLAPGALNKLMQRAAAQPPGAVSQERLERMRRTGILPPRGGMGAVFTALGTPANMIAAAVNAPPGQRLSEAGQAFMQRREGAQAEMIEKIIPYEEGEAPVGLRSGGRGFLSIVTDPAFATGVGRLTAAGRAAKAATPAKFMGATAERLGKLEQIKQGLASSVGLRVPFTAPTLPLLPKKIDAAMAAATQAGLQKLGETFKAITYRGPGKTATDWLKNAFSPLGASATTAAVRSGAEEAAEALRRNVFDDVFFTADIQRQAEDIAAQVTPTAGRIVEPGEVFAHAWDWWENAERFPERFVDTPDVVKQYGTVLGSKFDELLAYQREAGMPAPELHVPLSSVRRKAVQEIRETEQALELHGERGIERVGRADIRRQLRQRPEEQIQSAAPTVYHGTRSAFETLDPSHTSPESLFGPGLYFTEDPSVASTYATGSAETAAFEFPRHVRIAKLKATNPLKLDEAFQSGHWNDISGKVLGNLERIVDEWLITDELPPGATAFELEALNAVSQRFEIVDSLKNKIERLQKGSVSFINNEGAYLWLTENPFGVRGADALVKRALNKSIVDSGFDSLTHIGGGRQGNKLHRVWVVFDKKQVVPSTNQGAIPPSAKRPGAFEFFKPSEIEGPVVPGRRRPKVGPIREAEPGRGDVPGAFGRRAGKRREDVPIGSASEIRATRRQRPFDQIAEEQAALERTRRATLAADLNASITASIDNTLIDPRYLPVVFNEAGLKFLGVTNEEARLLALFGDRHPQTIGIKARDKFHRARTFVFPEGHPRAGTHLGAADIDRMAREGTLPGYEGRRATTSIVDIGPRAILQRLYTGRRAAEETRFLSGVAARFGTKIRDVAHGAELERAGLQRMPKHWFLKDYAFTPEVFRELKPHLSYLVNPGPVLRAMHATAREAVRLWSEWTVLFPATIAANTVDEMVRASMLGATTSDFAYALALFNNDWRPFNRAIEQAADMAPDAQFLRGLSKDRIEGLTDGKVRPDVTPGAATPAGIQGFVKDPATGARIPHVFTPHEILREAFSRKWAGGGYRMTDLQDAIDVGLRNASRPSVMRWVFHDSGISPFSRKFLGLRPLRKLQQAADDYPRLASAVSLLRRGLTPDEVSGEMGRFHPNVVLTPFERKLRNAVAPFYRWMRFAVPYSFRITLERPTLAYLTWKAQQYLGLGGPRLEESDVPNYLRQLTGVPFAWTKDEQGRSILSLMSGNRMLSFQEITRYLDPQSAADTAYGMIFPALTYLAEIDDVADKDDVLLGVRMNNKLSTFLRRTFRYANILDQMMLPKGQSEEEKSVRRRDALLRTFSPLSISTAVAGEENRFRRYQIRRAMSDADAKLHKTLSRYGRVRGNERMAADVEREWRETKDELLRQYDELPVVTEPVPPFLQGAPR